MVADAQNKNQEEQKHQVDEEKDSTDPDSFWL